MRSCPFSWSHLISITIHGVGEFLVGWTLEHREYKWLQNSGSSRTRIQHLHSGKRPCFGFPDVHTQIKHRALTSEMDMAVVFNNMAGGIEAFKIHLWWPSIEGLSCWWDTIHGRRGHSQRTFRALDSGLLTLVTTVERLRIVHTHPLR